MVGRDRLLDLTDETAVYDRAANMATALTDYLDGLLALRRRGKNDLISALVTLELEGDKLTSCRAVWHAPLLTGTKPRST